MMNNASSLLYFITFLLAGKVSAFALFTDFSNIDNIQSSWLAANKQWGGDNGGVIPENINILPNYSLTTEDVAGIAQLIGHGALYSGEISGVSDSNTNRATEVGSAIVSREYYGPGQYRARVRFPSNLGATSTLWTFHYEEFYPDSEQWQNLLDEGLHPQGNADDGFYIVRNHEIDIEVPTALKSSSDITDVSFLNARLNNWRGTQASSLNGNEWAEYSDAFIPWSDSELNDGQWHIIGFDWHTDDPNADSEQPSTRIDYFLDGEKVWTSSENVPDIASRIWIGLWYPRSKANEWAGSEANYSIDSFDIDYVSFIPFEGEPFRTIQESYPEHGLVALPLIRDDASYEQRDDASYEQRDN